MQGDGQKKPLFLFTPASSYGCPDWLTDCLSLLQMNVEGPDCSRCKPENFHLAPENKDGCLSCFCMGITQQCSSSALYRHSVRPLNWTPDTRTTQWHISQEKHICIWEQPKYTNVCTSSCAAVKRDHFRDKMCGLAAGKSKFASIIPATSGSKSVRSCRLKVFLRYMSLCRQ